MQGPVRGRVHKRQMLAVWAMVAPVFCHLGELYKGRVCKEPSIPSVAVPLPYEYGTLQGFVQAECCKRVTMVLCEMVASLVFAGSWWRREAWDLTETNSTHLPNQHVL
jgi:hypothetical protein